MRIRGAKTELEEAGLETEGMVESTAKLRSEILALSGVDIMENANEFKSTYKIMDELAAKWENLTDIQQATVTELIAGKRQGNIVSSLMTNFDTARQALETSMNSAGSAMKEHEKWQQSLEARINSLKASWQSLSQSFMDSSFLKFGIDTITTFIDVIDKLISTFGTFQTLIGGFAAFKGISKILSVSKELEGIKSLAEIPPLLSLAFDNAAKGIDIFKNALSSGVGTVGVLKAALKGLWTVIVAHPILATVAAVGLGIAAFNKWHKSAKELAEEVDELTSSYKTQHDELTKGKSSFQSEAERYVELSKGVNKLGENVSLTADEYSEYQQVVNSIADQVPSLISGYDSQGNAILGVKDNVEDLVAAYEKLIKAQNSDVLTKTNDIYEDFENVVEDANTYRKGFLGLGGSKISAGYIDDLEKIMESDNVNDAFAKFITGGGEEEIHARSNTILALSEALEDAGMTRKHKESANDFVERALKYNKDKIKLIFDDFNADLEAETEGMKSVAEALLSNAFDISDSDYYEMSDTMKSIARQIVNSFDYEFFSSFAEGGSRENSTLQQYITDMLDEFNSVDDTVSSSMETAFNLEAQFNGGEISFGEYARGVENAGKLIDELDLDSEYKSQIKLSLGIDEDGFLEEYRRLRSRLANSEKFLATPNEYMSFIEGLSSEEVSVLWDIIPRLEESEFKETIAEIESALKREMMLRGLTFDLNLEVESAGIEALNTAMAESVSGVGLSSESINALKSRYADLEAQGYDLSSMFEETSHGVRLNRQEFDKLEKAYASQKLAEVDGQLNEMKDTYDQLGEDIKKCTDPVEKAKLFSDRQLLAERISEAATLATQYQALTSAYNDWLAAEEAGQERDMYEQILEGFENVDDEISRGWVDDGTIEFLELLTGRTDLVGKSAKELKSIYKGLDKEIKNTSYSVRDFFTVDEDGNSTSKGVYNFLDAVGQLEEEAFGGKDVVKRDKNGRIIEFDFQVAGGDKAIADALGISEELVQIMVRAADDAGFVVTMDGTYKQLADLENEARAAVNTLNEIFDEDYSFDFNTTSIDSLNKQLEEAHKILDNKDFWNKDGTFNFDAKGATEAMTIVSTLQAKLDTLTQEQYGIGLTVEDEEFEKPLENLQEYGRTVATLNQLELNQKANVEEIKLCEETLDKIAQEFDELPDEKKIEIGLVGETDKIALTQEYLDGLSKEKKIKLGFVDEEGNPLTKVTDVIQKKIESGEIKIPTILDIQANMDKNIEQLVDLAWLNSGLLSSDEEETIRKKYNIEIEGGDVDTSDVEDKVEGAIDGDGATYGGKFGSSGLSKHGGKTKTFNKAKVTRKANIEIIAETLGVEDVDNLTSKLKGLDDKTIQAIAEVLGQVDVDKLKLALGTMNSVQVQAIVEAIGKGDVEGLKTAIGNLDSKTVQTIAEAFGYSDVNELIGAIDNLDPKTVQAVAQALGLGDVNTLQITINNMQGNTVDAKVNTEGQASKISTLQAKINGLKGKIVKVGVSIAAGGKKKAAQRTGADLSEVNGTANVNGTTGRAFKQGSWGTKNSGTALVGELGREVLIRNGRYYTVGDYGAEFIKYQRGDIILNHVQSEQLFKNGRVTADGGRAKALVGGTAFAQGTAFSKGSGGGIEPDGSSSSSGSDSSADDKFEEVIDWIETILDRVERSIDRFEQQANNIYKSWTSRNKALNNQISEIGKEIGLQQQAYNRYMQEANSVGLSSSWTEKVRNGEIDIDTITDENLADKIGQYTEWYEKALDCKDAIEELKETEASLYAQRLENVATQYEGVLGVIEHEKNMLEEYISQSEAQGWLVSANYYNALASNEKENLSQLKKEKNAMLVELQTAMQSGTITKYSEAWYEMIASIDEVTLSIAQSETQLKEYQQTLQQLSWETFDLLQDKISAVTEETDFLIELLSSDKLYDDNGQLTDSGMATMGQHGVAYNTHMYQADLAAKEAERLKKELSKDPYDTDLEERYREMISLQQEHILAAEDEKNAIRDMVEEGIELELDALQELIDKKNEALESERDLYEYQKRVKEQTEEIASLEKQMASYSGDTSEEAKAKVQELKVSLEEAKADLQETEYDKYISDQQQLLDELYLSYEEILNTRLDNLDALVSDMITEINTDATAISSTLSEKADSVGYTLSDSMNTIWDTNSTKINNVITTYGDRFTNAQTTTNNALSTINTNLQNMITQLNSIAKTKVKSASVSSAVNSKRADTPKSETPKTETPKATTPTIKAGGKINAKGAQIYDYAGDKSGERQLFRNDPIYKVLKTNGNWLQVRWHKLSKGITGWFKKGDVKALATGARRITSDDVAWTQEKGREFIVRPSDGAILTPVAKNDSVLNASASNNIWDMANSPAEFIKDNLNLGVANIPNNSTVSNTYTQNLEKVVFNLPNVKNYDELLAAMKRDPNFERLLLSMTLDRVVGKSSLAKGKAIR